jgi:hypothetical protein
LRVDVDEGGFVAGLREIAVQVDGQRAFSDPAFLVGQRDDDGHSGILI